MTDTLTEQQLEKLNQLYTALDELKERFLSLTDAGKALQQSFETATASFLSKQHIAPVFVPYPATQPVNAQLEAGQKGGTNSLLNTANKAGEKLFDTVLGQFIEKALGKKNSEEPSTKITNPTGFRRAGKAAVMPSRANAGNTKTIAGIIAGITMAYGLNWLRNNVASGPAMPSQMPNPDVAAKQTSPAIAALPVAVMNWPPSLLMRPTGEGGEEFYDKTVDTVVNTLISMAIKEVVKFLARLNPLVTAILGMAGPAYAVSRVQQEDSKGLVKWRTEHPLDYAKQQEVWGIKPVQHKALPAPSNDIMRLQQKEPAGPVKWSTQHSSDYTVQKEKWGIDPVNLVPFPAAAHDTSRIQQKGPMSTVTLSTKEKYGSQGEPGADIFQVPRPFESKLHPVIPAVSSHRTEPGLFGASVPVFVTNWPSGLAAAQKTGGSGDILQKIREKALDKMIDKVLDKTLGDVFDKTFGKALDQTLGRVLEILTTKTKGPIAFETGGKPATGGILSLISKAPSFLPKSWLGSLAGLGRVGAALAAPVGAAGAGTTVALAGATAAAGYGIGTLLNKGMGWVSDKVSGGKYGGEGWLGSMIYDLLHPSETQVQNQNTINVALKVDKDNRLYAETKGMNTEINLKRGDMGAL